jgi:hypothetical protein
VLLSLLVHGCATGVFSSRKLERATYDSVAFRFIAANDHPDHDTIANFRRRFLKEIEALFVQGLLVARDGPGWQKFPPSIAWWNGQTRGAEDGRLSTRRRDSGAGRDQAPRQRQPPKCALV